MIAGPVLPRFVCLSTYPPRECGIATFSRDLIQALKTIHPTLDIRVAALNESADEAVSYPPEVQWQLDQSDVAQFRQLAKELNTETGITVLIEHEYGIFGGSYGAHLLEFLRIFQGHVVTILHTTLPHPPEEMKAVTQELVDRSTLVQVFSERSAEIVRTLYHIDAPKLLVLPHGIHPVLFESPQQKQEQFGLTGRTVLTTFGMLSRGKGIEYVLESLPEVVKKHPTVLYLIVGATHPIIRRREGESYREELQQQVQSLGLQEHVRFVDRYLPTVEVLQYLKATDIYIATPLSPEQAVSGTFSYALGTGRAVISTAFSQAEATLTPEIGRLVPIRDADAYGQALHELLADVDRLPAMHEAAYRHTRSMLWTNVAHSLLESIQELQGENWAMLPPIALKHLDTMTDRHGLVQFAEFADPNNKAGYTLDDNARALQFLIRFGNQYPDQREELLPRVIHLLKHLRRYQISPGKYVNYLGPDGRTPTFQNDQEDRQDSFGRILWTWGELWHTAWLPAEKQELVQKMFLAAESSVATLTHLRAISFAILGLSAVLDGRLSRIHRQRFTQSLFALTETLIDAFHQCSTPEWQWFEPNLRYANGTLPLALFKASAHLPRSQAFETALKSLRFLTQVTFYEEVYVPIGQSEWYHQGALRSTFDQQPEDPASTVWACAEAFRQTQDPAWQKRAEQAFSWFLGNNLLGIRIYDDQTGGCYDGLRPLGVNENQGAESLVSYLLARLAMEAIDTKQIKQKSV